MILVQKLEFYAKIPFLRIFLVLFFNITTKSKNYLEW